MSSISPQKGKGFFQDMRKGVLNFFSGRRATRKQLFKPIKLTRANEKRKQTLKRKLVKTQKEKQELQILRGKRAEPEHEYRESYGALMRDRPTFQKKFNKYYSPPELEVYPTTPYIPEGIGFYQHPQNDRDTLDEAALLIPENSLPAPNFSEVEADIKKAYRIDDPEQTPMKIETQAEVELRTAPFLFGLWYTKKTGEESPFLSLRDIPDSVFDEFQRELVSLEENPNKYELLFGQTDQQLAEFIELHEIGAPEERVPTKQIGEEKNYLTKLVTKQVQQMDGSLKTETRVSIPGAIRANRYLASLTHGKQYMIYHADFDKNRCALSLDEDKPKFKPLTTLKSSGCLTIFNDVRALKKYMEGGIPSYMFFKNWIVLREQYVPFGQDFGAIFASSFLTSSFILDALENWGFIGMDPLFYKLVNAKYKRILYTNSSYLVKDKEFARFFEAVYRPDPKENFFILDSKFYTKKYERMLENPFISSEHNEMYEVFLKALDQNFVYGMTPYMAYLMKKQNVRMWNQYVYQARDPRKHNKEWETFMKQIDFVYNGLTPREKIVIDYLQYLRFLETLQEDYNFSKARDTYKDLLSDEEVKSELLELYTEENPENREMMTFLQTMVTPRIPLMEGTVYRTRNEVKSILDKFKLQLRIMLPPRTNNTNGSAVVENVRPRVSERPVLSLRLPPQLPRSQMEQIRSRLSVLKSERNQLQQNNTIYNSLTKKRRNRVNLTKLYKNLERLQRTRGNRQKIQVKRASVEAKLNRLEALNRNIQSLELQLQRLVPLPASPVNRGSSPRTATSSNSTSP
jgi:hypothetical protein